MSTEDDTTGAISTEPTALVVEDEAMLAELYTVWLEEICAVETVYHGNEAIEAIDDDVDVVCLDRQLPGPAGDEVLETVREVEPDLPVAIVSAVTPDYDVIDMEFDAYVTKPVDAEALQNTVVRLLEDTPKSDTELELRRLEAKKTALQAAKHHAELATSDAYSELTSRIEQLREQTTRGASHDCEQDSTT